MEQTVRGKISSEKLKRPFTDQDLEEIRSWPTESKVEVTWYGGNGPFIYEMRHWYGTRALHYINQQGKTEDYVVGYLRDVREIRLVHG